MTTRRLLPLAILPMLALPRAAGVAATVATAPLPPNKCGEAGGSFIACDAVRDVLPLATGARCPLCGGMHLLMGRR